MTRIHKTTVWPLTPSDRKATVEVFSVFAFSMAGGAIVAVGVWAAVLTTPVSTAGVPGSTRIQCAVTNKF